MLEVVVATKNAGKVREFNKMLGELNVKVLSLKDFGDLVEPVENGATFFANAKLKAVYYAQLTNKLCIADDSGLTVDALDGAPGVLSARYAGEHGNDSENNNLLLKNMENNPKRDCAFVCALVLANPAGEVVLSTCGEVRGTLLIAPTSGSGGFGYDPLFLSLELNKSFADATAEEKNSVSHRGKALRELVKNWQSISNKY